HDDTVLHSAVFFEGFNDLGNGTGFLADGAINTDNVFTLLVEDGVDSNGGFPGLTVPDDQLPLTPANRRHGVNRGNPGLKGLVYGLSLDNPRGFLIHRAVLFTFNRPFTIQRNPEGINDTSDKFISYRHRRNPARGLHQLTFLN